MQSNVHLESILPFGRYGFEKEVREKYDSEMFDLFQSSWVSLPLCTTIDNKVLILHGGLFSRYDLNK